jgi:hypothetical protein
MLSLVSRMIFYIVWAEQEKHSCYNLYAHAEHTGQELFEPDHMHKFLIGMQFSHFSNVHFLYPQHARKEVMLTLSMRVPSKHAEKCVRN